MIYKLFFLALLESATTGFLSQQTLTAPFPINWDAEIDDSCTLSKSTAFEILEGPIDFSKSPLEHPEQPKITPAINASTWEQWEFDSVSSTGMSGFMVAFSRDASYAFFGQGNLRVEFYMSNSDGSVLQELDYLSESTIITCENYVKGIFNSSNRMYSFHVTKDMKHAQLLFESPQVHGTINLTAVTPPHLADGTIWPSKAARPESLDLAPGLWLSQPMAGARAAVDATMRSGKRIRFTGIGGHLRLWANDSWFNLCDGWHFLRATVGPYTVNYWEPISRLEDATKYYSAYLFHHEELLVSTRIGVVSTKEDYILFRDELDGELSGRLADKNTGHILEFVSPSRGVKWKFFMRHIVKQFEMGLGGGTGLSGFANHVVGGEVGGQQYEGKGLSEQVVLPPEIVRWRIWIVYGIGFLQYGKSYVIKTLSYIL